jgi:mannosyl-3-phosphoglycerate phosphatase
VGQQPVLILYTDLDGTLLDEQSYSFDAARPALERLRGGPVLLVPCTSKTRGEVEILQRQLGFQHPFIVENGGAVYLPASETAPPGWDDTPVDEWIKVGLGVPRRQLVQHLREIRRRTGVGLTSFEEMSPRAVAAACGLTVEQARLAKNREFDEPFTLSPDTPESRRAVAAEAERAGLTVSQGGRFLHLSGGSDKGRAVKVLGHLLQRRFGSILTVGLGDSPNDLPMLQAVARPILVQRPDGIYHPELVDHLPDATRAPGIGPDGWNRAVLGILDEFAIHR